MTLADWDLWQNESFGAWLEASPSEVVLDGARVAGSRTGVQLHGATVQNSVIVGRSANTAGGQDPYRGVGLYHGGGYVDHVTFAHFVSDKDWKHPVAVANGAHTHQFVTRVSDVTLIDTPDPLYLSPSPDGDRVQWIGVVDTDGSLTGTAGTYVSHAPMTTASCGPAGGGVNGVRCDTTDPTTAGLFVDDLDDGGTLGPATVTDGAGRSAPLVADDAGGRAEFVLAGGGAFDLSFGRATPTHLETILFGRQAPVSARVTLPWPHGELWVYEGWGAWATPVPVSRATLAPASGWWWNQLDDTVRMVVGADADDIGHGYWNRWLVCAEQYCGDGTGSARS
jgi:hypothetical protein